MIKKYRQENFKTKNCHLIPSKTIIIATLSMILFTSSFSVFDEGFADEGTTYKEDKSNNKDKVNQLIERVEKLREKADKLEEKVSEIRNNADQLEAAAEQLEETSGTRITLEDLGVLQLAAHDLFLVDREQEIDHENGKLDLSTLLDYGIENIAFGGEPRNRENIMLFTVASELGEKYLDLLDKGKTPEDAQKEVIKKYHKMINKSYKKAFGESLPESVDGKATFTENLALRTIHDFLPGNIVVDKAVTPVLDTSLHGKMLKKSELKQSSSKLDGQFDSEFRNIRIVIPPEVDVTIDLLERDSSFAQQFDTVYSFEFFLDEVSDGSFDESDEVMKQIRNLFSKGLFLE